MLMAHFMQTLGDLVGNGNCCVGGAIPLVEAERTARFSRNIPLIFFVEASVCVGNCHLSFHLSIFL